MLTRDYYPIENDREVTVPLDFLTADDKEAEEPDTQATVSISEGSVARVWLNEEGDSVVISPLALAGTAVITYTNGTTAGEFKIGLVKPGAASVRFAIEKATSVAIVNPVFAGSGSANPQDRNATAAAGAGPSNGPVGQADGGAAVGEARTFTAGDPIPESAGVKGEQAETTKLEGEHTGENDPDQGQGQEGENGNAPELPGDADKVGE